MVVIKQFLTNIVLGKNVSNIIFKSSINSILIDGIKSIGPYGKFEARNIVDILNGSYTQEQLKNNHTKKHIMHAESIASVIVKEGYDEWKKNYIHLSYEDITTHFIYGKFPYYPQNFKVLVSTSFENNLELLKEFNENYKANSYKVLDANTELKPLINYIAKMDKRYSHFEVK